MLGGKERDSVCHDAPCNEATDIKYLFTSMPKTVGQITFTRLSQPRGLGRCVHLAYLGNLRIRCLPPPPNSIVLDLVPEDYYCS